MDDARFWQIIKDATAHDPEMADEWDQQLVDQLVKLTAAEILAWDTIFGQLVTRLYRNRRHPTQLDRRRN